MGAMRKGARTIRRVVDTKQRVNNGVWNEVVVTKVPKRVKCEPSKALPCAFPWLGPTVAVFIT